MISKALIDSDINHDVFTLVINEEQNYFRLEESIRPKDDQMNGIKREKLMVH